MSLCLLVLCHTNKLLLAMLNLHQRVAHMLKQHSDCFLYCVLDSCDALEFCT
eukprot:m.15483 g.15483  ORF g.15483 m.15483 type:complete len:52 (-) comp10470_c0_seq1:29-184(-)